MLSILLAIIVVGTAVVFVKVDFSNPSNLEEFVTNKLEKTSVKGVSIAIIKDNKIDQTIQYGYANENMKVNDETLFQIASLSKVVTATTVLKLHEEKFIDLDDDVNKYLPFQLKNPHFPNETITIRMLLDHTSSIKDNWDVLDELYTIESGGGDSNITLEQFVKEYLDKNGKWYSKETNFTENKPGETFEYSNVGYGLLGFIVEKATNMPFDKYVKETIFKPIGMKNTEWKHQNIETDNIASPYEYGKELPHYSFPTYPDGSLKTNVIEFSKFLTSMSIEETDDKILQPETIEEMLKPHSNEGKQALGWSYSTLEDVFMKKLNNGNIIGHTGSDPGIFSIALYNREKGNGLVIFMNKQMELEIETINIYSMIKRLVETADL
ncbi:CubicO group peptidase (beta-lactamase class C family) [Ureibacillus xyleni]|uniref:CubicO group peptidase (Beta-lactamase class C family) n=1 Tax=Ureibacillus xyleni TaxID=614648 RepID=A0A285TJV6_9BACL|nr:serine hydrolase domain-containing protein [Ureibacillus xyleni]SOC22543.1 CubicO group peptidase (beta-lactamase class C family) [Ureibacillus xyleni]